MLPNLKNKIHSTQRWLSIWARRNRLANKLMFVLLLLAVASGFATYGALTESPPFGRNPNLVATLLIINLCIFLLLGTLIARRVAVLVAKQRQGRAGSRLHLRVVAVFSALAVTPAILVAVFAAIFFIFGVQNWFSNKVQGAVNESLAVAQSYLTEHQQVIRGDVLAMANDLNRAANSLSVTPQQFAQLVVAQAQLRGLTEAVVFDGTGRVLARTGLSFSLEFEPISDEALDQARRGEVAVIVDESDDRVRALVQLDQLTDMFLFVGRLVDQKVLDHVQQTKGAVAEYRKLEDRRTDLQLLVTAIFIIVALLLLAVAVWMGLNFANRLVGPISALIDAADDVASGKLATKIDDAALEAPDELGKLTRAFNRMTAQLSSQQQELVAANRQLDQRRRFTEAVLSGVSAGVIGTDENGIITLPNAAAAELLGYADPMALVGQKLIIAVPQLAEMFASGQTEGEIETSTSQPPRILLVRITTEVAGGNTRGHVVTFDDVTDLVAAQRKAAWADVARRIAHEIKNPLTPIQLSAERLQRRYMKEITSDAETFKTCTDTIIRQVNDIGRMVDEFSAFARMPAPVMKPNDLHELIRQTIFLMGTAKNTISFSTDLVEPAPEVICDGRQISQALTNLLKNAIEAIEGREGADLPMGQIHVTSRVLANGVVEMTITDNGKGLPQADRARLTEPYVTTRSKGTGLGLAIVKKILEDHHGGLQLADNPAGAGAMVTLHLPLNPESMLQVA